MLVIPTTELGEDPEMAIELGLSWGIRNFEFKTMWQARVPNQTDAQKEYLKGVVKDYGVNVVAFSPGFGLGVTATEEAAKTELEEKLPRTFEMANDFNCKRIVIFGFNKTEGVPIDFSIDKLGKAAELAKAGGFELVIEPISGNYCDSGESMVKVIEAVGSDVLRVNWDPGNVQNSGYVAYPDEYEKCKKYVTYCHLKNWFATKKECRMFDDGDIALKANLEQMKLDGYNGYLSIETHTRWNRSHRLMPIAATKYNAQILMKWLDELNAPSFQTGL